MLPNIGKQVLTTILKHENKTTSYKLGLVRAINDLVLTYPGVARHNQDIAVPLLRIAELWAAYYWCFMDESQPIYQGRPTQRDGTVRNDISFRPHLTRLRAEWQRVVQTKVEPADGFFLFAEMRSPRRRTTYPESLLLAYDNAIREIEQAVKKPIRFVGQGEWSVFLKPDRLERLPATVMSLPGTSPKDVCVVVSASLWQTFHQLSLYIEALAIHEWSLFTEGVVRESANPITRGDIYSLLTARPDNRRPLSWERNQVDILLLEQVTFTCPWTQRRITKPSQYDLDHLLPLTLYPINELWNLLPVDRHFNQHIKRDRVPSKEKLAGAEPYFAASYSLYSKSLPLNRVIREDAALRFLGLKNSPDFAAQLAQHAVAFIGEVSDARYVNRF